MSILGELKEKPWEAGFAGGEPEAPARLPAPTVGLRVFLGVVAVLFSLLIVAYADRMAYEDWRPVPEQRLLWFNTVLLILASLAIQGTLILIRRGRDGRATLAMTLTGVMTTAFLLGQFAAWRQLQAIPAFDITNPAIAFFYLITGLHGLHLLGGLVAWGWALDRMMRTAEAGPATPAIKLCATYWHFLLGVWLVLFALLFSGNDNLEILMSICGLR